MLTARNACEKVLGVLLRNQRRIGAALRFPSCIHMRGSYLPTRSKASAAAGDLGVIVPSTPRPRLDRGAETALFSARLAGVASRETCLLGPHNLLAAHVARVAFRLLLTTSSEHTYQSINELAYEDKVLQNEPCLRYYTQQELPVKRTVMRSSSSRVFHTATFILSLTPNPQ